MKIILASILSMSFIGCSVDSPKELVLDEKIISQAEVESRKKDSEISKLEVEEIKFDKRFEVSDEERKLAKEPLDLIEEKITEL